jgi:hypothetical protein
MMTRLRFNECIDLILKGIELFEEIDFGVEGLELFVNVIEKGVSIVILGN